MTDIPLQFADSDVFERVRTFFIQSGFTSSQSTGSGAPCAEMLSRFFSGNPVPEDEFLRTAGEAAYEDLRQLGLITNNGEVLAAPVRIRPLWGNYVLSDLKGGSTRRQDDFVFAPDDPDTLNYLSYLPMKPCDSFLEACGGSGIAALIAAGRYAGHAYSSDIAERSTVFARFSAALSGIANFTAVTGDTYEPVGDLTFDRIAVHPPYVPGLRHSFLFDGGGADGEEITRKHIENLPPRLKPGGRFYCRCMAGDRLGEPLEQRIRKWLGGHESDFDVALQVQGYQELNTFVLKSVQLGKTRPEEIPLWEELFAKIGLQKLALFVIVIQRHDSVRPPFTVRREEGAFSGNKELDWLIEFETARARRGASFILESRLKANRVLALNTVQTANEGDWTTRKLTVEVVHPHQLKYEIDPLSAYLLPKLDGTQTGAELFQSLVNAELISSSDSSDAQTFAAGLGELASGGFLTVEGFEPPSPRSSGTGQ